METPGAPISGDFTSADATALTEGTTARFVLYGRGPTTKTALTLNAEDQVIITDLTITSAATNATVTVYDGADVTPATGEIIWKGIVPTNTTQNISLNTPHYVLKGSYPKCKASAAGQVDATLHGSVVRIGT